MLYHLHEHAVRHRGDVRPGQGGGGAVQRMADAGGDDLGIQVGIVIQNGQDIIHDLHTVLTYIVQAAHENADVSGPGQRPEQRLVGRKTKGHIYLDVLLA